MILLKDNDKITKNIITGESSKLIELFQNLTDQENFKYYGSVKFIGQELPDYYKNDSIYIDNDRIGHNGNGGLGHIYIRNQYKNPKQKSTIIVSEALKTIDSQQQNTIWLADFFGKDMKQSIVLEKLLTSLDPKTLEYIMANFWEDFYYFCMEVLPLIKFEQVDEYELTDLNEFVVNEITKEIEMPTSRILENIPKIDENVSILKLARNLKNKKL